jgi:DNA-binding transcriptional LysR family regulator
MFDSLEFRLLKYILAVAESRNFTRAAERLFLAQPSLSKQIRELEEDIGFPIFERSRDGVNVTLAGQVILAYASEAVPARDEIVAIARAVHLGNVPPLRLGFSSFVNAGELQSFETSYHSTFPGCEIQLSSGDPVQILHRIDQRVVDCAILPMPLDVERYSVQQIARSPLVVCMKQDDESANGTHVDIHTVAPRIKIFRDPQLHPSAHSRLVEMFEEIGIPISLACSAATPGDMQLMVKAGYGLALIDQITPLESGLVTRPIAGLNWTADTAFVHHSRTDHIALPFIERMLARQWRDCGKKPKNQPAGLQPEQLRLLA